jgi:hypothetical protein
MAAGVELTVVRSDPNTDHYETFAMLEIERLAKQPGCCGAAGLLERPILSMHTKGVSAPGHEGKRIWRRAMEEYVVRRWRHNVQFIADGAGYDAIGLNWHQHGQQHFSGNFWIARPDWIRRLPDYVAYHHALSLTRYTCEMWIGAQQWCRAYSLGCADFAGWNDDASFAWLLPPPPTVAGAVRLNLGCWKFYADRWTNIDLNPDVRVDLREDVATLPSFKPDSVDEIYAGHVAEHLADVETALRRWLAILKPGGILTVTVPDGEGAVRLWRDRARFPVVDADAGAGLVAVASGYRDHAESDADAHGLQAHRRLFDRSVLRLCLQACGFVAVREVDNHPVMHTACCRLGWQIAVEARKPAV